MATMSYLSPDGDPVQAMQLTADNVGDVVAWCGGLQVSEIDAVNSDEIYVGVNVPTIMGNVRASQYDYIVQSEFGTFYPFKPGVFEESFTSA